MAGKADNKVDFLLRFNRLPPAERRGYSSVFNALYRITKEEGVLTLWRVTLCLLHWYRIVMSS